MDESKTLHENGCTAKFELGFSQTGDEFLGFDPSSNCRSRSLFYVLKCFLHKLLLHGADKVVKDRRALKAKLHVANDLVLMSSSGYDTKRAHEENENGNYFTNFFYSNKDNINPMENESNYYNKNNNNNFPANLLAFVVVLMMKFVGFQISLMISFFTFPIWSSYVFLMFLLFPFQTMKQVKGYFMKKALKVWSFTFMTITSSVSKRAQAQKSKALKIGRAFFSSVYVCFVLLGLLAFGFFLGGLMIQHLVEKPVQLRDSLTFDYSKSSPVAFVPLEGLNGGAEMHSNARVVPRDHKLQVSVSLTVPESEYNQELGVFQVRAEFLSENGNVLASSAYPSMLRFKSRPIRYVETFLSTIPLIAGFQSESQVLNIKFTEFTEGIEPTTGLRVAIEQRAEHQPLGAGIPQIYEASLLLESELPRLKKIVWNWRRTMFVWSGIVSFLVELVFILAFLRPIIVPMPNRTHSGKNNACAKIMQED